MTRISPRPPPASHRPSPPADRNPNLRTGSRGQEVRKLENELKERGVLQGKVDGYFGPKTKAAVEKYERTTGLTVDGVVGNRIRRQLGMPTEAAPTQGAGQPAAATAAPAKPGKGGSRSFTTVNLNIKHHMPMRKVLHDVRKASKQGDLIGWNEIDSKDYAKAIKSLGPKWGHYFPRVGKMSIPNPISWNKEVWAKQDEGFIRTHNGMPNTSPHRFVTWVKLRNKATGESIVRMNTHLVSGAWSKRKTSPNTPWRRAQWNIHVMKMKNLIDKFTKKGLTVVAGGDFNRDSYKVLGDKVLYDNSLREGTHGVGVTLDYVMHTKSKDVKKVDAKVQGGYESDHDAVVVKYKFQK